MTQDKLYSLNICSNFDKHNTLNKNVAYSLFFEFLINLFCATTPFVHDFLDFYPYFIRKPYMREKIVTLELEKMCGIAKISAKPKIM